MSFRPFPSLAIALLTPVMFSLGVTQRAQAQLPAAPGDLALVQQHLRAIKTLTASFTQTDRGGKTLTGTLTLKQPGKIRFQYERGVPILIVGDGSALYFIDYSVRQVSRWPIGNTPLGVLLNPDRDLSRYGSVMPTADDRIISVDARDPKHPEYGRITLVFLRQAGGPAGLALQGWVALDAQNNRTTVRLSNTIYNGPVSDRQFTFNDPRRPVGRN